MMSESGKVHMRYGVGNQHEHTTFLIAIPLVLVTFHVLTSLFWDLNNILRPCDTDEKKQIQQKREDHSYATVKGYLSDRWLIASSNETEIPRCKLDIEDRSALCRESLHKVSSVRRS
jgi:hypothetical protein